MTTITVAKRIQELVVKHGTLRATALVLKVNAGYLSRLSRAKKPMPGPALLRGLGLKQIISYERAVTTKARMGSGSPSQLTGTARPAYAPDLEPQRQCTCGDIYSPGVHRLDGPCVQTQQPSAQEAVVQSPAHAKLQWVLDTLMEIKKLGRHKPLGEWWTQIPIITGTLRDMLAAPTQPSRAAIDASKKE